MAKYLHSTIVVDVYAMLNFQLAVFVKKKRKKYNNNNDKRQLKVAINLLITVAQMGRITSLHNNWKKGQSYRS